MMKINSKLIRQKRESLGISQEGLARVADVSTRTISNLELDQGGANVKTLAAVANALGCPMDDLLEKT